MPNESARHHLYFVPGMFGFGKLAGFDYAAHLLHALAMEMAQAGVDCTLHHVDVPPTASIRKRAALLAYEVSRTLPDDGGPVHLVGHSTGGLDARLVASPSVRIPVPPSTLAWTSRLRSVTTLNAPHFGTPLAGFFATVSGQRMLYALSAVTVIVLSLGAPPLAIASALVTAFGRIDQAIGVELRLLDRLTDSILSVLDPVRSHEVRDYLSRIRGDQGAVIQLTPEAMDLFQSGVEDRAGLRYQCVASMAPPPSPGRWLRALGQPWSVASHAIFTTLYGITARSDENYPCAAEALDEATEAILEKAFGKVPGVRANDGVVPIRSQIWGELVWAGHGDHLDVLGHFKGPGDHSDWLASGAHFSLADFRALTSAVAKGILRA